MTAPSQKVRTATYIRDREGCEVDGCLRPHYGKGMCHAHYEYKRRHGSLEPRARKPRYDSDVPSRLVERSAWVGECLEWTGLRDKDGYGIITVDARPHRAHRVAYELVHGKIAPGLLLRHRCDNPPCIRVDHLVPGTRSDNSRDMRERDRSLKGERNPSARLTVGEVAAIKRDLLQGQTLSAVAMRYGIGTSTAGRIRKGASWADVAPAQPTTDRKEQA